MALAKSFLVEGLEEAISGKRPVCESRDVKGMYKRAGEILKFTGISSPYEEPENPELVIYTDQQTIEESVEDILKKLAEQLQQLKHIGCKYNNLNYPDVSRQPNAERLR